MRTFNTPEDQNELQEEEEEEEIFNYWTHQVNNEHWPFEFGLAFGVVPETKQKIKIK